MAKAATKKAVTTRKRLAASKRRASSIDPQVKRMKFLEAVADGDSIENATKVAKWNKRCAYKARREDPAFRALWDDAIVASMEELPDIAMHTARLAPQGVPGASMVLIKLMQARQPWVFCERARTMRLEAELKMEQERSALEELDNSAVETLAKCLRELAQQKRDMAQ